MGHSVGMFDIPDGVLHEALRVGDPVGAPIDEVRRVRDDIEPPGPHATRPPGSRDGHPDASKRVSPAVSGRDSVRTALGRSNGGPAYTRPVTLRRPSAQGLLCVSFLAVGLALCAPAASGAVTAGQAMSWLNAQRAANGLPAGIADDVEWNEGCRLHMQWYAKNPSASNPHIEAPGTPDTPRSARLPALTRFWRSVRIGRAADHFPGMRPTPGSLRRST